MLSASRSDLTRPCAVCDRAFSPARLTQRTCSRACRVARVCAVCGVVGSRIGRAGLCGSCRPEIALLNRLYVSLTQERRAGRQPILTTCPEGHPLTAENTLTYVQHDARAQVHRRCRQCHRERARQGRQAAKLRLIRTLHRDMGASVGQVAA